MSRCDRLAEPRNASAGERDGRPAARLRDPQLDGIRSRISATWLTTPTTRPPSRSESRVSITSSRVSASREPKPSSTKSVSRSAPPASWAITSARPEREGEGDHERLAAGEGGRVAGLAGPVVADQQAQPAAGLSGAAPAGVLEGCSAGRSSGPAVRWRRRRPGRAARPGRRPTSRIWARLSAATCPRRSSTQAASSWASRTGRPLGQPEKQPGSEAPRSARQSPGTVR